ncbi:ABC transporter permease [Calidifontibacter sp. DB0510]|uniref:ABC transporter permease n=1 Tax=Metallococcus carri TaxID=1656884 RepID=A0A967B778_9MICO|nr:ABC transporter permease [Metallococcus carri]NHN56006.1 ABC transporter permease [Metallococcus carri]NOP37537.1 ABC transporter permease [Calidifontibacter sp. DB2511S]
MTITDPTPTETAPITDRRRLVRWPQAWRRPLTIIGGVIIAFWVIVAIVGIFWTPYPPLGQIAPRLSAPSGEHLLGTDSVGRDVLSRIMAGAHVSLPVPILVVALSMILGTALGAIAGYFGRVVDEVIMRLTDLVLAFPTIILAMVVTAALGPGLQNAVIALLAVSWPSYARVTRSLVLGARGSEYVVSGRLMGVSAWRSLTRDVLPNILAPIVVLATMDIGNAILLLSGLSFLGLGTVPPTPEWGAMVSEGVEQFSSWWIATFAGLAIFSVVLAFNFLGDSLRDALDPRAQKSVEGRAV